MSVSPPELGLASLGLTSKRALVTGAGSGLGAHFAAVLSRAGAQIVLAGRSLDRLESVASPLRAAGGDASCVVMDVRDAASVCSAMEAMGTLDIVVNNAGVTRSIPVLDESPEDFDAVLATNLRGAFLVATEAARRMRDAGRPGSIINVASILGLRQGGHVTAYAISKAGLVQMSRQMALELARYGIRVNALAPGYFATDLNAAFLASENGQSLIRRIPQRRLGRLEDLDGPLLLLASDAGRYMTGCVIPVDGGHLVSSV